LLTGLLYQPLSSSSSSSSSPDQAPILYVHIIPDLGHYYKATIPTDLHIYITFRRSLLSRPSKVLICCLTSTYTHCYLPYHTSNIQHHCRTFFTPGQQAEASCCRPSLIHNGQIHGIRCFPANEHGLPQPAFAPSGGYQVSTLQEKQLQIRQARTSCR
jgi:hypothetical protein